MFLAVAENLLYYICIALGVWNIYKIWKVPEVLSDPFEITDLEMQENPDAVATNEEGSGSDR